MLEADSGLESHINYVAFFSQARKMQSFWGPLSVILKH